MMEDEEEYLVDDFGEDADEGLPGQSRQSFAASDGDTLDHWTWLVTAQQPWNFRDELCTLTCMQSADGEVLRFELLAKHRNSLRITCTDEQFQSVCEEQPHSSMPARVEASIRQLFSEGLREYPEMARPASPEPGDDASVDDFGEDGQGEGEALGPHGTEARHHLAGAVSYNDWNVESQRSWDLDGELCTLICLRTSDHRHLQFEVIRRNGDTITITCTEPQFQEVCDEQEKEHGLSGVSAADAAIRQLFREGLEECPPSPVAAGQRQGQGRGHRQTAGLAQAQAPAQVQAQAQAQGQGGQSMDAGRSFMDPRLSSRLKAALMGWNRCSQGLVAAEDMRLLLLRLHPACPVDLLEGWLKAAGCSGAGSCVSVDRLVDGLMQGLA